MMMINIDSVQVKKKKKKPYICSPVSVETWKHCSRICGDDDDDINMERSHSSTRTVGFLTIVK